MASLVTVMWCVWRDAWQSDVTTRSGVTQPRDAWRAAWHTWQHPHVSLSQDPGIILPLLHWPRAPHSSCDHSGHNSCTCRPFPVTQTGLSLVESDHVTRVLASDWSCTCHPFHCLCHHNKTEDTKRSVDKHLTGDIGCANKAMFVQIRYRVRHNLVFLTLAWYI